MTTTIQESPELKIGFLRKVFCACINSVRNFFVGAVVAVLGLVPVTKCFTWIAEVFGFLSPVTRESNITGFVENLKKSGLNQFNSEALINAPSYLDEYARQYNSHFPSNPEIHITVLGIKASAFFTVCIVAPLLEELFFRGLIQGKFLGWVEKKCKTKFAETKHFDIIGTSLRVGITAALFSLYHLTNAGLFADSYVLLQLFQTFILGIGFGVLKESRFGMWGAIGAHAANNFFAISSVLLG